MPDTSCGTHLRLAIAKFAQACTKAIAPSNEHGFKEDHNTHALSPCFQLGFTEPEPLDPAGALLTHLCTLTIYISTNGGIFLWHYPRDRSHWALPSSLIF